MLRPPPTPTIFPYTTLFRSMELQKEMLGEHFRRLEAAPETGDPVVYTFVPGNLTELVRSFGALPVLPEINALQDRKSTRLNSSHVEISYAVFCLKKKSRSGL